MKICFKCNSEYPATSDFFYRHPRMADGLLGKCKECTKKDSQKRLEEKPEEVAAYERKRANLPHRVEARSFYKKTESGRSSHAKALRKQIALFPEKYRARTAVRNAVRDGKLLRLPCVECGEPKSEGHHEDYSKPLDVVWLCNKHHKIADRLKKEREESKCPTKK